MARQRMHNYRCAARVAYTELVKLHTGNFACGGGGGHYDCVTRLL